MQDREACCSPPSPGMSCVAAIADARFGFVASFFATTMTASSARTRELLGWTPTGPTLVEDILDGPTRATDTGPASDPSPHAVPARARPLTL
ncbi:MAG: hypothetical protein ACRDNW_07900 [Trebonia sp.]